MSLTVSCRSCNKPNRTSTVPGYRTPSKPPMGVQQNQNTKLQTKTNHEEDVRLRRKAVNSLPPLLPLLRFSSL
ncbi:hypothetical protein Fmac_005539 [Flemingia macrophylla]|uniref:Uncharacterized protein n=1 Tax=Flemingia macrophylla TaxID=520843 RepID=A0ABD1N842_9FABA